MSQENNFIPLQDGYKPLTPFRLFVKSNFPFIENTYESLDNYGLYCKVVEYLNNVIANENTVESNVQALYDAFVSLNTYVSDYFDNLDVQNEINNKLDEMATSGQLQIMVANIFSSLENQIQNVANGGPSGVFSTYSDLVATNPNHNRIYVVVQDGNWYYYNTSNNTWTSGGQYQGTEIADESITIVKLDELLQSNFNVEYSSDIDLGAEYVGYIKVENNEVVIQEDTNYRNRRYDLDINTIYQFNGYNESASTGLVILDENNAIVYNSNPTTQSGQTYLNKVFSVSKNGYKAYIGYNHSYATTNPLSFATRLRKINNIYNNLKISNNIPLLHTVLGAFSNNNVVGARLKLAPTGQPEQSSFLLYPMENGKKYHIKGYDHYQAKGFVIFDSYYQVLVTNTENMPQVTLREIEYTATQNGFIGLSTYAGTPSIEILQDAIEVQQPNKLKDKKIYCCGDSITLGVGNNNKSYIDIIRENNSMQLTKDGIGGSTLVVRDGRNDAIVTRIENLSNTTTYDYIIVQGGINDSFNNDTIGTITDNYDGTYDTTTLIGAVEKICYELITKFPTSKKLFVLSHRLISIVTGKESNANQRTFWNTIIDVLNKWGIPYIDLMKFPFASYNSDYYNNYFDDNQNIGLHPNNDGYNLGYVEQITNKLKEL